MRKGLQSIRRQFYRQQVVGIVIIVIVAGIGTYFLVASHAATPFASSEAESGTPSSGATTVTDSYASGGSAVKFGTGSAAAGGNCPGLADGSAAFCDTFDAPMPNGERSGDLSSVWGTSRNAGSGNNSGQGQADAWVKNITLVGSCGNETVSADNDIKICNGMMNDAVSDNPDLNADTPASILNAFDDNGDVTSLAMYPKQPFDFSSGNGKVVFDVSDDSGGSHMAWPEFWMSNAPVPDPFIHFDSTQGLLPQYGFGIRLDAVCAPPNTGAGSGGANCGPNCNPNNTTPVVTVGSAVTINNFVTNDSDSLNTSTGNLGTLKVVADNCVTEPTQAGQLNHFEIDVSENQIDIYGTNAGTTSPLIHLASIPNAKLGFTRGLIWLEDVHYNANKEIGLNINGAYVHQGMHTFTWDNVGFNGPVLPRDLAFEVPDAETAISGGYPTEENLGWYNYGGATSSVTVTDPNVSGISSATGGLLVFDISPTVPSVSLTYSINGHSSQSYTTSSTKAIGVPIPLSEVVTGSNTIVISDNDPGGLFISNVGLIMQGAGGIVDP